jgi:hypothetical protein
MRVPVGPVVLLLIVTLFRAVYAQAPVTPQQFGALSDGIHDDRPAIQAALDSGNPIYLPMPPVAYMINSLGPEERLSGTPLKVSDPRTV